MYFMVDQGERSSNCSRAEVSLTQNSLAVTERLCLQQPSARNLQFVIDHAEKEQPEQIAV